MNFIYIHEPYNVENENVDPKMLQNEKWCYEV